MERFHNELSERHVWYAEYHQIPYLTVFHFVVLIGLGSFFATAIQETVLAQERELPAQASPIARSAVQLTGEIFALTKKQANAADGERAQIAGQIAQLTLERRNQMLSLAKGNPRAFLLSALPEDVRVRMPESVQSFFEQHFDAEGTLTVKHIDPLPEDDPGHDHSAEATIYEIEATTASGKKHYQVNFGGNEPPGLESGTRVRMRGVALENILVPLDAADGEGTTIVSQPTVESVAEVKKVLVILFNFTNNTNQPFTPAKIAETVFTGTNSTNNFYQETSFGKIALEGDVVGWYTIPYTNENCSSMYNAWSNAAEAAATAAGVAVSSYPHRIYIWNSNPSCGWGGIGTVGGNPTRAWIPGYQTSDIYSHEFGHNLRARHAQWLKCGALAVDLYANCTIDEYGDKSDVMGNAWGSGYVQFNGSRKIGESWLTLLEHQQTVTQNGTYTLTATEYGDTSTKVLKIPKGNTNDFYYVFYRQPFGFDAKLPTAFVNGVSINIWNGSITTQTKLVDTTPGDNSWSNAPLADGRTFFDQINGVTITQLSRSAGSVTVQVTFGPGQCTRSKPTVSLSPLSQSGAPGVAKSYSLSVRNNDTSICGNSAFSLASAVPAGWSGALSTSALTLAPGATGSASLSVTPPAGTPDGTYTVTIQTSNANAAVHSASASASYVSLAPVQDTTAPVVSISAPADGSTIASGNVSISASASDASGIADIIIKADGQTISSCKNKTSCSTNWQGRNISAGTHTITVEAIDKSSNKNIGTASVTFSYGSTQPPDEPPPPPPEPPTDDTTPPSVSITSPANGATLRGNGTTNIAVSASDASGIASMNISIDGATVSTCSSTASCSYGWRLQGVASGTHTIVASATDAAGNTNSVTITVSRQ